MNRNCEKKNVVILGAGGHAHVIADIVSAMGDKVIAFLDDDTRIVERSGNIEDYVLFSNFEFVIGIGNAEIRERMANNLKVKWYTAIHPSAIVSSSALIKEGTVVMPNAVVNARATVGKHCIINSGAIVEHDNKVDDFAHISVGVRLGGTVTVGRKTWVGIGSTVKNNITICDNCMIGAGAVVVKDIKEAGTFIGVPVRKIK